MHPANCSYPKSFLVSQGGKAGTEPGQVILLNNLMMLTEVSATPLHPWTFLSQQPRKKGWNPKRQQSEKSHWEIGVLSKVLTSENSKQLFWDKYIEAIPQLAAEV